MQLPGKVALVTGAARRVGREIALELAAAGADVIVHSHSTEAGETAQAIRGLGRRALTVRADLTRPAEIEALFGQVAAEFQRLDVLVNSAAVMERGEVLTLGADDWQRSLDLNLTAPFLCAQQAARLMLPAAPAEGESGVIVNITDGSALRPWPGYPAHSVSKAGLVALTEVLAKALAPHIRVNAVSPGPVLKPDDWDAARWEQAGRRTLLKRTGSGYDVARAVRFLIENDYITGETLVVDGGDRFR